MTASTQTPTSPTAWWSLSPQGVLEQVRSSVNGLSSADAAARLKARGKNELRAKKAPSWLSTIARQAKNPLLLLLVFAAIVSVATGEWIDAAIVLVIIAASVGITASREVSAQKAAAGLSARSRTRANVIRDGKAQPVAVEEIVAGDVVVLQAGSLVPADCAVIEATDLFVS